jgi:hypothetical protein
MVAKFHCLSLWTTEPVGVLFVVGFCEALFFLEVLLLALLLAEIMEALHVLACCQRPLCFTEFRIPDIVEKVDSIDKVFFL